MNCPKRLVQIVELPHIFKLASEFRSQKIAIHWNRLFDKFSRPHASGNMPRNHPMDRGKAL